MTRKKGMRRTDNMEHTIGTEDVKGDSFDIMIAFDGSIDQPRIYMDELVAVVLRALLDRHGKVMVKVNWWSPDLQVIKPSETMNNIIAKDALQGA